MLAESAKPCASCNGRGWVSPLGPGTFASQCHACNGSGHATAPVIDARARFRLRRFRDEPPPDMPDVMSCPKCRKEYPDFDGFGVVFCDPKQGGCGFCQHLACTGDVCDFCARALRSCGGEIMDPTVGVCSCGMVH